MSLFPASEPDPAAHERAQDLLRDVFGYAQFRGQQQGIIEHVIDGGDALVLMPTGGGKSLCYQIPALVRPGVGIVVSPLIALMKDQVDALRQAGVRAAYLNSSLSPGEARQIEEEMRSGALDLVYVAPERLVMPYFLDLLERLRIALFAIDEAHCVSQWGHNFRPEYRALTILHERFPTVPRIALTATADGPTRKDIVERLQLDEARVFVSGFDRPNIAYRVVEKKDARNPLLHFLRTEHPDDAGSVYCLSRRKVDEVADFLSQHGRLALPYHAGLDAETRQRHQDRFLKDEGVVVVATVAFGMGIDKPNVRFVAHLDVPRSLEAYYQETGRAGRDGLPATAWMTYGLADVISCKQMVQGSELDDRQKRVELQKLDALLGYCETATCRRQVLLNYFSDNSLTGPCGNCDICLNPVKRWDGTIAAQKALSAVYRTGQRFGVQHLVDVLTGKETEKILERGHHLLKTFGVGREIGRNAWQAIFRQLVAGGYLAVDVEGHGGLMFGPKAAAVVKGEDTVEFREHKEEKAPKRATSGGRRASGAHELEGRDATLFEALRHWRLELSREQGVPPYVILHDATLVALSTERPADMAALATIPGVGRSKLDRYGQAILEIIAQG